MAALATVLGWAAVGAGGTLQFGPPALAGSAYYVVGFEGFGDGTHAFGPTVSQVASQCTIDSTPSPDLGSSRGVTVKPHVVLVAISRVKKKQVVESPLQLLFSLCALGAD